MNWKVVSRSDRLFRAVKYSLKGRNALITAAGTLLGYTLLVLSSFPSYSYQIALMDSSILVAIRALTSNIIATAGITGYALILVYSLLLGVSLSLGIGLFRGKSLSQLKNASGALPGFLAGGCASCGAGLLGLMGFAGALSLLPFNGNLLRLGGIVLLGYFLVSTGDPDLCEINPGE